MFLHKNIFYIDIIVVYLISYYFVLKKSKLLPKIAYCNLSCLRVTGFSSNQIIKTIPHDKTESKTGQSPVFPLKQAARLIDSCLLKPFLDFINLTNRKAREACRRMVGKPITMYLRVTHPPISCFCFPVWTLEVNNTIITTGV